METLGYLSTEPTRLPPAQIRSIWLEYLVAPHGNGKIRLMNILLNKFLVWIIYKLNPKFCKLLNNSQSKVRVIKL